MCVALQVVYRHQPRLPQFQPPPFPPTYFVCVLFSFLPFVTLIWLKCIYCFPPSMYSNRLRRRHDDLFVLAISRRRTASWSTRRTWRFFLSFRFPPFTFSAPSFFWTRLICRPRRAKFSRHWRCPRKEEKDFFFFSPIRSRLLNSTKNRRQCPQFFRPIRKSVDVGPHIEYFT